MNVQIYEGASNTRDQLSFEEFEVRHERELAEADEIIGWSAVDSSKTYTWAQVIRQPPGHPFLY